MGDLPGYDAWKTRDPDEDRCEFCGVNMRYADMRFGPDECTGECGRRFDDPDRARDERMDDGK